MPQWRGVVCQPDGGFRAYYGPVPSDEGPRYVVCKPRASKAAGAAVTSAAPTASSAFSAHSRSPSPTAAMPRRSSSASPRALAAPVVASIASFRSAQSGGGGGGGGGGGAAGVPVGVEADPLDARGGGASERAASSASSTGAAEQEEVDHTLFETAEAAALAYDEKAKEYEGDGALLNLTAVYDGQCIGEDVKDVALPLIGEDGGRVLGFTAGMSAEIHLRLKFFDFNKFYIEIHLDCATNLPKMDAGLGTCDAYVLVQVGEYHFRSRVVRNSLNPQFNQTFRIGGQKDEHAERLMLPSHLTEVKLSLFDWDRTTEDDHMGDAVVKLDLYKIISGELNQPYQIFDPEAKKNLTNAKNESSKLHVRFEYYADDEFDEYLDESLGDLGRDGGSFSVASQRSHSGSAPSLPASDPMQLQSCNSLGGTDDEDKCIVGAEVGAIGMARPLEL